MSQRSSLTSGRHKFHALYFSLPSTGMDAKSINYSRWTGWHVEGKRASHMAEARIPSPGS